MGNKENPKEMRPNVRYGNTILLLMIDKNLSIGKGFCLQCEYCRSNSNSCNGVPQTCSEDETACIILTMELRKGTEVTVATYKGCTRPSYCAASPMSIRVPSYHQRRANKCCRNDLCNSGAVELPPLRLNLNRRQCPGCLSSDPKCLPTEIINCRGWEVFCVFYEVRTDDGGTVTSVSKGGCGNKEACMHEPNIIGIPGLFLETVRKTECTHAPMLRLN
ncbi:phospholipase A2 inhibitor and Ly6/PLAUR domain-containing protein-like [Sphaerodactylus townsendi]|uniref:phospholipase A2 inhibitor and Ly6/PLAUR domain-containing protein-like n=1 Tax=Sphaerodactylus townsendi TaxID=933632 RepID=UPI0020265B5E|nr:phospholipase A2 inhibitor and Ly6/PLAUR domain-containing protein-like [Sphaerodactylus townsendi]